MSMERVDALPVITRVAAEAVGHTTYPMLEHVNIGGINSRVPAQDVDLETISKLTAEGAENAESGRNLTMNSLR